VNLHVADSGGLKSKLNFHIFGHGMAKLIFYDGVYETGSKVLVEDKTSVFIHFEKSFIFLACAPGTGVQTMAAWSAFKKRVSFCYQLEVNSSLWSLKPWRERSIF
jgi:hypothetical protein